MCPLHVEALLQAPVGIGARQSTATVLIDYGEARRSGETVGQVERFQVLGDIGLAVGIDDSDGLPAPVALDGAIVESDQIKSVGLAELLGAETERLSGKAVRGDGVRRHRLHIGSGVRQCRIAE